MVVRQIHDGKEDALESVWTVPADFFKINLMIKCQKIPQEMSLNFCRENFCNIKRTQKINDVFSSSFWKVSFMFEKFCDIDKFIFCPRVKLLAALPSPFLGTFYGCSL